VKTCFATKKCQNTSQIKIYTPLKPCLPTDLMDIGLGKSRRHLRVRAYPFEHVNKRVSRLAANIPLIHHNLSPLSFVDVPEDLYIDGLLGVYELNRIELMRDVFVWTYERSCDRYQVVRHTLGEPDPFRLHYRKALIDCVGEAIRQVGRGDTIDTGEVLSYLAKDLVPENDRGHFLKIAREEIAALHEGNFARYRLRPSEFKDWQYRKA